MTEQPTNNPSDKPTDPPAGAAPHDKPLYDLEPDDRPATPISAGPPASLPPPSSPKLNAPGLIDDFDEDEDFDEPAPAPKAVGPAAHAASVPAGPTGAPFVKPGMGNAQVLGTLGAVAALGGAIFAAVMGQPEWYKTLILSLYHTGLQTVAGIVAVFFAARMAERQLGSLELAAARMLLIVSLARAALPLSYNIPYTGRFLESFTALGIYALGTLLLFRLSKHNWIVMMAAHTALVMVLWAGASLEVWASAPAVVKPVVGP